MINDKKKERNESSRNTGTRERLLLLITVKVLSNHEQTVFNENEPRRSWISKRNTLIG